MQTLHPASVPPAARGVNGRHLEEYRHTALSVSLGRKPVTLWPASSGQHFIFTTANGTPPSRHNVRNQGIVAAADKAGLQIKGSATITTHDLPRTFSSHLILGLGLGQALRRDHLFERI
jgi:integrase